MEAVGKMRRVTISWGGGRRGRGEEARGGWRCVCFDTAKKKTALCLFLKREARCICFCKGTAKFSNLWKQCCKTNQSWQKLCLTIRKKICDTMHLSVQQGDKIPPLYQTLSAWCQKIWKWYHPHWLSDKAAPTGSFPLQMWQLLSLNIHWLSIKSVDH